MKEKLLIVDGHNLLFQMFYGMPNKIYNHENKAIQGVIGFTGALLRIIRMNNPTHIVVLFDKEQELLRHNINENYKNNRPNFTDMPEDDNPFSQLEFIYLVLDELKIKHTEVDLVETDDMIASYCFKYMSEYDIVISSFDSDFYSLINDNVKIFRYRGKNSQLIDKEFIKNKFDINSKYFADYKALVGDASDNIKGVKGIGPKTAASLINEFGDINSIIINAIQIKNEKLKSKIIVSKELLQENIKLIKYDKIYNLPFNISELSVLLDGGEKTTELLFKIGVRQ